MSKIVVSDSDFPEQNIERNLIEKAGMEFAAYQDRTPQGIIEHLKDADGAITSYGNYTAEVFEALPQLKVVSRTGTGFDTIDVEAATKNGTAVCIVPGYGTEVVSDHAIALTMACLRRINEIDADMRAGIWDFEKRRPLGQVHGRVFGVVGMGHIGRAVARKASGLGFKVICWDRKLRPGEFTPEGYQAFELDDLLKTADVVSFHTALTPETHHLLNADRIKLMKEDAVVINVSRGAVIDTDAVAEALTAGKLWGAGIDVFETEPVSMDAPIMKAPHTVLSPHDAYFSEESGVFLRTTCAESAIAVVQGKKPYYCVNPEVLK